MGAKNLKAVVVGGKKKVEYADRFGADIAVFCYEALCDVKRKILNCLRALARVFKI